MDSQKVNFEQYIKTGLPKLEYQYVTSVFEINATDWNLRSMPGYLRWILNTFNGRHKDIPTFLFFFVINIRDLHVQLPDGFSHIDKSLRPSIVQQLKEKLIGREKKVFQQVTQLVEQNPLNTTLITPLLPVLVKDLEDWIRNLGEENQSRIDDAIKNIVRGLKKPKQEMFGKHKKLDMTDIELFQEMVYYWANDIN